jgi:hypothetical protein
MADNLHLVFSASQKEVDYLDELLVQQRGKEWPAWMRKKAAKKAGRSPSPNGESGAEKVSVLATAPSANGRNGGR